MDFSYFGRFKIHIALSKNNRLERKFLGSLVSPQLVAFHWSIATSQFVSVDAHNIYGPLIYLHLRICGQYYFNMGVGRTGSVTTVICALL